MEIFRSRLVPFAFAYNEELLLRDWILHHGTIFGFENLYIIDNGSNDSSPHVLREFRERGVQTYEYPFFEERSQYLSKLMTQCKLRYEFLIPLDIDEFVAHRAGTNGATSYSFDSFTIRGAMNNLPRTSHIIEFTQNVISVERQFDYSEPLIEITEFFEKSSKEWNKVFFRAELFSKADAGNHGGTLANGTRTKSSSPLCLFHFHYLGANETSRRASHFCLARGYPLENDFELAKLCRPDVAGHHRIGYLLRLRQHIVENKALPVDCGEPLIKTDSFREHIQWLRDSARKPSSE